MRKVVADVGSRRSVKEKITTKAEDNITDT